jgi:hypothetical protein
MPMSPPRTDTGNAIRSTLISPNEADSNGEVANVVDGLFAIARAIHRLADAVADPEGERDAIRKSRAELARWPA